MGSSVWLFLLLLLGPSLLTVVLLQIIPGWRDDRVGAVVFSVLYVVGTLIVPFLAGIAAFDIRDSLTESISWFILLLLLRVGELALGAGALVVSMWNSPHR